MKRVSIIKYREASSDPSAPSVKDLVATWDSNEKRAVLSYLSNDKYHWLASAGLCITDAFTGDSVSGLYEDYYRDEEGYCWCADLPYYIDKYNVGVPRQFIDYVLSKQ